MTATPDIEAPDPQAAGLAPARLERTVAFFRARCAAGEFPGGQLVVRRNGRLAVDLAVGHARGVRPDEGLAAPVPVTPATRFAVFSAGKPVVAVAVALLEARGQLDIRRPIAAVWPEFGQHGKAEITPLDVLVHRGGVLMPALVTDAARWGDWQGVMRAVEQTVPTYPRGTLAYHPYEFGWVLAGVVERVTGRDFRAFVRDEIALPLGVPELRFGASEAEQPALARAYWLGTKPTVVAGLDIAPTFEAVQNAPGTLAALAPGGGLVSRARDLARVYDMLAADGAVPGRDARFLPAEVVRAYTSRNTWGWDRSNRVPLALGRGFIVGTLPPSPYGMWNTGACFGHQGAFCSVAFGDRRTGLAVAAVTNGNRGQGEAFRLFARLASLVRHAVA